MNNTENKYKIALEIVQPCFVSMLKELDSREMCDTEAISFLNLRELVERATPKKLVATKCTRRCPSCNRQMSDINNAHPNMKFCPNCGQALDWEVRK